MITKLILRYLCRDVTFTQKVLPYLKPQYFDDPIERAIFTSAASFVTDYKALPSQDAVALLLQKSSLFDEDLKKAEQQVALLFSEDKSISIDWLLIESEKWVKEKAIALAIYQSLDALEADKKEGTETKHEIPKLLQDALAISFDEHIGHDLISQAPARYDFYHQPADRLPFDLTMLNKITGGGLAKKTLNVIMADTAGGKSMFLCHVAARAFLQNKTVLYITLEMAEERIAERIDANLLNVDVDDLAGIPKDVYLKKIAALRSQAPLGELLIKEFPPAQAHAGHFRHVLHELKLKRNLTPDLVVIDYANIAASARFSVGAVGKNMYGYVKSIMEEIRGLAVEFKVPILTATQTNRSGFEKDDPSLSDVSESFGTAMTADLVLALIPTPELAKVNQVLMKQLKNRYKDSTVNQKFVLQQNKSRMFFADSLETTPPPDETLDISDWKEDKAAMVAEEKPYVPSTRRRASGLTFSV
jgi:replicative DNA helicase